VALQSIFSNLIANAINYTPDGGEIRLKAGVSGSHVSVAVSDNGIGIEGQHLDRIFERFYRVQTEKTRMISGTGLGLSIAREMLVSVGGSISVDSQPGKGSVFTVSLPCPEGPQNRSGGPATQTAAA
jgi:signal transduction histidine kinase